MNKITCIRPQKMTKKRPRRDMMPLWTDAYIADTTHLDLDHHGAYFLLLMKAWREAGDQPPSLPDDDMFLRNSLSITQKKWASLKPYIMAFWELEDGRWTQKKLTQAWKTDQDFRVRQAENGTKGGRPPSQKSEDIGSLRAEDITEKNQQKQRNEESPAVAVATTSDTNVSSLHTNAGEQAQVRALDKETISEIRTHWNAMADRTGLNQLMIVSPDRLKFIIRRLKDVDGDVGAVLTAIRNVENNPHWTGKTKGGFRATFDWVMGDPKRFIQALETEEKPDGVFNQTGGQGRNNAEAAHDNRRDAFREILDEFDTERSPP